MKKIRIGARIIGHGEPCFVIAEVGVNHNGDVAKAKQLIDAAAAAEADAVKFQTFAADRVVAKGAEKASYQKSTTNARESQYRMLKKLELTQEDFADLHEYAKNQGIEFLSTPFDCDSVDSLDKLGISAFKIASGEVTNTPLLKKVAKKRKPIILSTGMSSLCEIETALDVIGKEGGSDVVLLHCVSEYPCVPEHLNLRAINALRNAFGKPTGFSDHSLGVNMSIAAVALGACVLEKHITLNKMLPGPDHKVSLEPDEFTQLVEAVRDVEKALGDGVKRPTDIERETRPLVRKSIVAKVDIPAMSIITKDVLDTKRPATGIQPEFLGKVIGRKATVDIKKDEAVLWDKLL